MGHVAPNDSVRARSAVRMVDLSVHVRWHLLCCAKLTSSFGEQGFLRQCAVTTHAVHACMLRWQQKEAVLLWAGAAPMADIGWGPPLCTLALITT